MHLRRGGTLGDAESGIGGGTARRDRQGFSFELAVTLLDFSLRDKDGTIRKYYDHWILGKTANAHQPRWSVIRDVLRWVE